MTLSGRGASSFPNVPGRGIGGGGGGGGSYGLTGTERPRFQKKWSRVHEHSKSFGINSLRK